MNSTPDPTSLGCGVARDQPIRSFGPYLYCYDRTELGARHPSVYVRKVGPGGARVGRPNTGDRRALTERAYGVVGELVDALNATFAGVTDTVTLVPTKGSR